MSTPAGLARDLFIHSPQPMWVYDASTLRFLKVNAAAIDGYGYSKAEFLGMTLLDIRPPADREILRDLMRGGALPDHRSACWRHVRKDGAVIDVQVDVEWVSFDGRAARVATIQDITELRRAADTIRATRSLELRYRVLFEQVSEGIYQTTPDGRHIAANPALARMLGYDSVEEVMRTAVGDLCQDPAEHARFVAQLEHDGVVRNQERGLIRKDGRPITVIENAHAIRGADGTLMYYEGILTDITERKQLEEQYRQAQKMEAIGRLAGGVAHDFNNILTAIIGYVELALDEPTASGQLRDDLYEIESAARRAAGLTHQLLAFSRQQLLEPQAVDINITVSSVDRMVRRVIGEDITVITELEDGLPPVRADAGQFEQVLMNLIINARDAMPRGGTLRVATRRVAIDAAFAAVHRPISVGSYVEISVTDTGSGIPDNVLPHIFEPFYTTKARGHGTGLGLSMVYGVVKQSGGFIWVTTKPQHGTTFSIHLPPVAVESIHVDARLADARRAGSTSGGETVLIVEDEDRLRELLTTILQRAGYAVLGAANGEEGMRVAAEHAGAIDLLLSDIVMPGENGAEFAVRLRGERPNLKVKLMSGYVDAQMMEQMNVAGFDDLLRKPFKPADLLAAVRHALAL